VLPGAVLVLLAVSPLAAGSSSASSPQDNGIFSVDAPVTTEATLPANFQETTVFSGLTNPTAIRFASDGRVFVA
jgi:hypothetical protein